MNLLLILSFWILSPLDCKEIKPVNPKGNKPWIFIGRTDAEAETLILWPPDAKNWLTGKDPDAGKDGRQEEKGTTEDEMVGWLHQLNGREFGWTPGIRDGQGGQACWGSWGRKGSQRVGHNWWLNWTELTSESLNLANLRYYLFAEAISLHMAVHYLWLLNDMWETLRMRKNMTPIRKTLQAENSQEGALEILTS